MNLRSDQQLVKFRQLAGGSSEIDKENGGGGFVKKHRRILSSASNASATEKRAKTLGFKTRRKVIFIKIYDLCPAYIILRFSGPETIWIFK